MFQAITKADMVLDTCGRATPPAGFKFVDLPYFIPARVTFSPTGPTPYQIRVKNNALSQFRCNGLIIQTNYPIRIKWPNGRYLAQNPSFALAAGSPLGAGSGLLALNAPVDIESGANITVEVSNP